jgi:hypothetical protein
MPLRASRHLRVGNPPARQRVTGAGRSGALRRASAIVVVAGLLLAGCGAPPAIPPALAGLPRTHALQGSEALREIARLHGRSIRARDGFVAHYEQDGAVAMLYVSTAHLEPIARWQLSRMVDGIQRGRSNAEGQFSHLRAREREGLTLYSALGLGQVHYFYRSAGTIVWLAADPQVAERAVADTVRLVR